MDLYSEQVAGYYDPDSTTLFGVTGADPLQLRLVLAHEMVHALQGQYLPLDSILHDIKSNDRLTAAQSVLEGQATLVSIRVLSPGVDITAQPEFWEAGLVVAVVCVGCALYLRRRVQAVEIVQ